jgi:predicted permease
MSTHGNLEVELSHETGKAIIEGKTSIPFKTFVSLVLQRKVTTLFKKWQDEPVVIGSELLTNLASAPDDRQEDRATLVLVSIGTGILFGVFCSVITALVLSLLKIDLNDMELGIILAALVGIILLVTILQRMQQKTSTKQKIYERMEKVTDLLRR